MTDPIADMLTRIRNALAAGHESVMVPHSNLKEAIVKLLKDNDFVADYEVQEVSGFKSLNVELQPENLSALERVSKPGRRIYASAQDIPLVLGGRGMVVISTSGGVLSGREARKRGLGGELICRVW
jgi:small subunit ribosomal protein S8